jgi:hypothetical protein
VHGLGQELHAAVAQHRPRQQARFLEDLEPVADAEHGAAGARELPHRLHHRAEAGDGPGAEVVAVGEPAGKDHGVDIGKVGVLVPDQPHVLAAHVADDVFGVVIAVRAGEDDHSDLHGSTSTR